MTIPDYQTIMLRFLQFAKDGKTHSKREATDYLAEVFKLSEAEKAVLLPSGKQTLFDNRVGWARTYLKKAGLIKTIRWGYFSITDRGSALLKQNPETIDVKLLKKYPEFKEFITYKHGKNPPVQPKETPQEILDSAYEGINAALAEEVLQQLKSVTPKRFEDIVIDLLVKMNYGGGYPEAAKAIGKSGDGGVDGVINQDILGVDRIYVQAKCWGDTSIGSRVIRDFIGAIDLKHADKGIFITTSTFVNGIRESIAQSTKRIILIDGKELAKLMIAHGAGVTEVNKLTLNKIDMDYFVEE